MKKICILVLDSVGIGAMPDAAEFGDEGSHTLGNINKIRNLHLPNLHALGLGNIKDSGLPTTEKPKAAYGRMAQKTKAKDTTSGHWELAGLIMEKPFRVFHGGFSEDFLNEWSPKGWLGNKAASGTAIIDELGQQHIESGKPIVYTSADSVFQVAAHEEVIPIEELYELCIKARQRLPEVGRIIARPFVGTEGNFKRTTNRKDYAVAPVGPTILDNLDITGVLGIGKIEDIFSGKGITRAIHTKTNTEGINATIEALCHSPESLIFTNLVDFDMLYGHRNDPEGYAKELEYFDTRLPEVLDALGEDSILFITADHGCDPTVGHTDHTREYVPVLVYGVKPIDLGTRETFADLGATVYKLMTGHTWNVGKAFDGIIPLQELS